MDNRGNKPQLGHLWVQKQGAPLTDAAAEQGFHDIVGNQGIAVQLFISVGSWVGALMFIGMLAVMGLLNSEESAIAWGIVFLAIYLANERLNFIGERFEPFLLALGLIGQALIGGGVVDKMNPLVLGTVGIVIEGVILAMVRKSRIQHFISTCLIFLSLLLVLHHLKAYHGVHLLIGGTAFLLTYIWVREPKLLAEHPKLSRYIVPVGLGLAVSVGLLLVITVNKSWYRDFTEYWWASTVLIAASMVYLSQQLLAEYEAEGLAWAVFLALALVLAPTLFAPGIAFSLLLLALGFYRGHLTLSALGVIALIGFTIMFYYNLQLSLLWKSAVLVASGLLLLALRWGLMRMHA